ncbi:hypothetical protein BGZ60DRAFT_507739 [Tricladium varicosporioides]|nr:hypothetical protein BGZ60DRAFT_507739 [Hymenoscyphus varicosporioides]
MVTVKYEYGQFGHTVKPGTGSQDQLIIALDFGTTYSGIAYAFSNGEDKADVVSIMEWPGQVFRQPKTPTLISYDPEDKDLFTWGEQDHEGHVVQGIKLLLEENDDTRPDYFSNSKMKELADLPKSPTAIASDFMKAAYKHALKKIEGSVPREYVKACQKKFVLTVPAAWSDQAKSATYKAAKNAGFDTVELIKEPEAAAMYTLHEMADKSLKVGDAFVICDAGGGTVDLISYEILQLEPLLLLKELVPSTGKTCGSMGLNIRFRDAVKKTVGVDQFYILEKMKNPPTLELAIRQFDTTVKKNFRGELEKADYINFPMAELKPNKKNNLYPGCWKITGSDIADIFKPLVDDIILLVSEQVDKIKIKRFKAQHGKPNEVKAIFLVGGFGSSIYLKLQLEKKFPEIQVIQPANGWAAIVKGAVLSRLACSASIFSTQATRHYGISAMRTWQSKDQSQPKYRDYSTGEDEVEAMIWYIRIGHDLKREQAIKFSFYRCLEANYTTNDLIFDDALIESSEDRAPEYPSTPLTKVNCRLVTDLRDVDQSTFKARKGVDGKDYVDIEYDLIVTIKPAQMVFSLEIKGKMMGGVSAKYH